mgnify:CR=1 FL=1
MNVAYAWCSMWCLDFPIHFYLLLLKALSLAILMIVRGKSNFQLGIETNVEFGLVKKRQCMSCKSQKNPSYLGLCIYWQVVCRQVFRACILFTKDNEAPTNTYYVGQKMSTCPKILMVGGICKFQEFYNILKCVTLCDTLGSWLRVLASMGVAPMFS